MKLAYVTPRYGVEVLGGAEYAARMLAERLVSRLGWDVEVFTSCALDAATWADHYPSGAESIAGVTVRRYPVVAPRAPSFLRTSQRVHANPRLASVTDQERWIDEQGPTSPALIEALAGSDADLFAFYPYLYYPTVRGLPVVRQRALMHPAAHDEASLRMSVFAKVFSMCPAFIFQTDGERRLVEELFPIADRPQLLLGLGVDPQDGDEAGFRSNYGIGERPYVFCLGRVDDGKGSRLLATYFAEYKRRHPGPLALVFSGPVVQALDAHGDIFVTGPVSDEEKWGALRGAEVVISPSAFEAFSLALVEGWAAGRPVMVNASCLATREHVARSGGGLWFSNYLEFDVGLSKLLGDRRLATRLAGAGERYVDERFRWPALIDRYGSFLEYLAERCVKKAC